jgi:plastocyanin
MQRITETRLFKLVTVAALIVGVMAAGLVGGRSSALAHEGEAQTFMIEAGALGVANAEALAFAPAVLQVHQGDTVMWHINSFHNVHFEESAAEFAIFPIVDGQPLPQLNPAVAFANIADGASYTGGDANTGLPEAGQIGTFSLVIDAPVGRYMYMCDIHLGMVGVIEVVADDVEIPSPAEVSAQGQQEMGEHLGQGYAALPELAAAAPLRSEDGVLNITAGSGGTGRTTVNLFSSPVGIITAGETVTWTNPADSVDPHFVNSTPYDPVSVPEIIPVEQPNGPPLLTLGPGFLGTTADGTTINAGDTFNSPFIMPGQSFSLMFADPGVYAYNCHIHPGMTGMIVVEAAA